MGYHRLLLLRSTASSSEFKPYPHTGPWRWVRALAWDQYPSRLRTCCLISAPGATSSPAPGNRGQQQCGMLRERFREERNILAIIADEVARCGGDV